MPRTLQRRGVYDDDEGGSDRERGGDEIGDP
jgi:hypothetical protein